MRRQKKTIGNRSDDKSLTDDISYLRKKYVRSSPYILYDLAYDRQRYVINSL